MMNQLHKANSRGQVDFGWLKSKHTFSFGEYQDPKRMGFGALRVINDDVVAPGMGFGTHPHRDMEIISIPVFGELRHKDTIGNNFIIKSGEVQTMSAGTGISHSEFNNSSKEHVSFLQIWIIPKEKNLDPSYSQKHFSISGRKNSFQLIVSPDERFGSLKINQDAFFSLTDLDKGRNLEYNLYNKGNGVYLFLIDGNISVHNYDLKSKDGLSLEEVETIQVNSIEESKLLIIEVPMNKE